MDKVIQQCVNDRMVQAHLSDDEIDFKNQDALIDYIDKDKGATQFAVLMLAKYGTERCIPVLQKAMYYKEYDVKCSALAVIGELLKEKGADFYVASLEDPKYRAKLTAVSLISLFCDERGVGAMSKRVKQLVSKRRQLAAHTMSISELVIALEYLNRYQEKCPQVIKTFEHVLKNWVNVAPNEREPIVANIAFFKDADTSQPYWEWGSSF